MSSQTIVGNLAVELGISDAQLQSGLANAVVQAQAAGQKMQAAINNASRPTFNASGMNNMGGFAQTLGRIADDAQYGFRGIVNNLEQLGQTAGASFGLSTKDAMAFGAVMTLLGIAVNQASDEIVKLTDTRTVFDKLATSAMGYAGSLNAAEAAMKALSAETSELLKKDATSGVGGFFGRMAQKMMDNATQGKNPLSNVFGGDVTNAQIQANKDAGRQALRNQLDMLDMTPQMQRNSAALKEGSDVLDRDKNAKSIDASKDMASAFNDAIAGSAEKVYGEIQRQLVATGTQANQAEIDARVMMGNAAKGVTSAFEELSRRIPELQLDEKLRSIKETQLEKDLEPIRKQMESINKQRENLTERRDSIQGRIDEMVNQRARSEVIGASAVFERNINAGGEDPQVKAIEKLGEELKEILNEIKGLG